MRIKLRRRGCISSWLFKMKKVAIVTVTYGSRWKYLSQVLEASCDDAHVAHIFVVNNKSENSEELHTYAYQHKDKITVINFDSNTGSANGFGTGLAAARDGGYDFVLLLDDDNVITKGVISDYITEYECLLNPQSIIVGNRVDLGSADEPFDSSRPPTQPTYSFFNVFSLAKVKRYASLLFRGTLKKSSPKKLLDKVEVHAFAYGGAFIPRQALLDAPLPDSKLFLYGDDVAYSWGVLKAGYRAYLIRSLRIRDVDTTFSEKGNSSHLTDLFMPSVSDIKVYYRMRNAAYISWSYGEQLKVVLVLSIIVWYIGLLIIFLIKKRQFGTFQIRRAYLIAVAFTRGLRQDLRPF